jgi:hypothetical protein
LVAAGTRLHFDMPPSQLQVRHRHGDLDAA